MSTNIADGVSAGDKAGPARTFLRPWELPPPATASPAARPALRPDTPPGAALALSVQLREATSRLHRAAESRPFIANLMAGRLDAAAHADLAEQYLEIYRELEAAGRQQAGGPAGQLAGLGLEREASLLADLRALGRAPSGIAPAARDYAAHLGANASSPGTYAAHAYARYLGDLSGGQAIASVLVRHYGLKPEQVSFYDFGGQAPQLRERFRRALDAVPLTDAERERAVSEARRAFSFAIALFDQLAIRHRPRS